jgi:hypothetical protein
MLLMCAATGWSISIGPRCDNARASVPGHGRERELEERGPAVTKERLRARTAKMIRELRGLGYRVEPA